MRKEEMKKKLKRKIFSEVEGVPNFRRILLDICLDERTLLTRSPSSLLKPPTRNRIRSRISYFLAFAESRAFLASISLFLRSFSIDDSNNSRSSNRGG